MSEAPIAEISADTLIFEAESLIDWASLEAFYKSKKIKCLNCPAAEVETFAQGAEVHGFDLDETLAELNQLMKDKPFSGFPPSFGQKVARLFGFGKSRPDKA